MKEPVRAGTDGWWYSTGVMPVVHTSPHLDAYYTVSDYATRRIGLLLSARPHLPLARLSFVMAPCPPSIDVKIIGAPCIFPTIISIVILLATFNG